MLSEHFGSGVNKHASISCLVSVTAVTVLGSSRAFECCHLCAFDCHLLTIAVRDPAACDSDVMEKPSRRWRGAVQQLADFV